MKPKILILSPDIHDPSSFYRAAGPFGMLQRMGLVEIAFAREVSWAVMNPYHVVFFHRPNTPDHAKLVRVAKAFGCKVWVDFDDDLWDIPLDNPAYDAMTEANKRAAATCCSLADIVTVSTEPLERKIREVTAATKVTVIPNALHDDVFGGVAAPVSENKTILWRGSATHTNDVYSVAAGILSIAKEFPDWGWVFMGWRPWILGDMLAQENVQVIPQVSIVEYLTELARRRPGIHMVPLSDNPLNRSKSNIAYLESSWISGSIVVAADLPEFKKPGVLSYKPDDAKDFRDTMKVAIKTSDRAKVVGYAQKHISENYRLSKANRARYHVLVELFEKGIPVLPYAPEIPHTAISED